MQPISVQINISNISAKVDGSIRFSATTPELTPEEKTAFFGLQNQNCRTLIQPEESHDPPLEVKGETEQKTCSQRLRGAIFVLWKQEGEKGTFDDFYKVKMERLIDFIKSKLE